ncbi:MAG: CoA transferase [Chloroflexi bacterium]|nr:CoA transferase [Chloroflexota bacterium]
MTSTMDVGGQTQAHDAGATQKPLAGVRVVDFTWIVAGPQATRILADMGAEVIRVENESYLDSVRMGMQPPGVPASVNGSGMFNNLSRNKKSITANLHHPSGREAVEKLIATADIVVENYSSGAFERMGFGFVRLKELNPSIIYISLSGFGHEGRDNSYITWGPTAQAVSGCTFMSGLEDNEPAGWGYSYLDHTAGYYGAMAALLALVRRQIDGEGQYLDLSQIETGMMLCGVPMLDYQVNGREYQRIGNRSHSPGVAPHNVYRCKGDDRWVAIAVETDEQWMGLCDALGAEELAYDEQFSTNLGRVEDQDRLDAALAEYAKEYDPRELMYLLQANGVPAAVVQNQRDKMEYDPQHAARNYHVKAEHPILGEHRFDSLPFRFSRLDWTVECGAPLLGEHTSEILSGLGYTDDEIGQMVAELAV